MINVDRVELKPCLDTNMSLVDKRKSDGMAFIDTTCTVKAFRNSRYAIVPCHKPFSVGCVWVSGIKTKVNADEKLLSSVVHEIWFKYEELYWKLQEIGAENPKTD